MSNSKPSFMQKAKNFLTKIGEQVDEMNNQNAKNTVPKIPKYDINAHNKILVSTKQTSGTFDIDKGLKALNYVLDSEHYYGYNPVGTRISKIRNYNKNAHQLTKKEIAEDCCVTTSMFTMCENNEVYPNDEFLIYFYDLFKDFYDELPEITLSFIATGYEKNPYEHLLFCYMYKENDYIELLKDSVSNAYKYFFDKLSDEQKNICILVNEMFCLNNVAKGFENLKTTIPYAKIISDNAIELYSDIRYHYNLSECTYDYYTDLNLPNEIDADEFDDDYFIEKKSNKYLKELLNAKLVNTVEDNDYPALLNFKYNKDELISALEKAGVKDIKKSKTKSAIIENAIISNKDAVAKLAKDYCKVILVK